MTLAAAQDYGMGIIRAAANTIAAPCRSSIHKSDTIQKSQDDAIGALALGRVSLSIYLHQCSSPIEGMIGATR
jgi:hypothetical protein